MSIFGIERPTTPGVLDEDAIGEGLPMSAQLLREISRTANYLRDAESAMLSITWPPDAEEAPLFRPAPREWTLLAVMPSVPCRPLHRIARARVALLASTTSPLSLALVIDGQRSVTTTIGTSAAQVVEWDAEIPPGRGPDRLVELWLRSDALPAAGAPTANSAVVGTPTSWSHASADTAIGSGPELTISRSGATWTPAGLLDRRTVLRAFDGEPFERDFVVISATATTLIARAVNGLAANTTAQALTTAAALSEPTPMRLLRADAMTLYALHVQGRP